MSTIRRGLVPLFVSASFVALWGCGDSKPSVATDSTTEATVKGVVKVAGAPVSEGVIVFDPTNYQRKDAALREAPIGKDGTYTIKTLTGTNQVRLGGSLAHKKQILQHEFREINVTSGENNFDFEVKSDK